MASGSVLLVGAGLTSSLTASLLADSLPGLSVPKSKQIKKRHWHLDQRWQCGRKLGVLEADLPLRGLPQTPLALLTLVLRQASLTYSMKLWLAGRWVESWGWTFQYLSPSPEEARGSQYQALLSAGLLQPVDLSLVLPPHIIWHIVPANLSLSHWLLDTYKMEPN